MPRLLDHTGAGHVLVPGLPVFFPFIDAVTTGKAFTRGNESSETVVAYIQVTISSEKKIMEKN